MSEDRRSRSRSRSRSPERGGEDNNAPPSDNGAPAEDNGNNAPSGGGEDEGVKLYVGNLDYCECILGLLNDGLGDNIFMH